VLLVFVLSLLKGLSHLILFGVPHLFNQWRGEALSRGKREIRDELSFQASQGLGKKQASSDEPESLASRICRTLDGVSQNGKWKRGTPKSYLVNPINLKSIH
jgi:hypothetical protein